MSIYYDEYGEQQTDISYRDANGLDGDPPGLADWHADRDRKALPQQMSEDAKRLSPNELHILVEGRLRELHRGFPELTWEEFSATDYVKSLRATYYER